jgi:hypothetical protein
MARKLLSIGNDAKTIHGEEVGYLTAVQYLAPHKVSGIDVCKFATPGCSSACLYTAGRGQQTQVQTARIKRTTYLFDNRSQYFLDLEREISALIRQASRKGFIPTVRLNGTSDLPYERMPFTGKDGQRYESIMARFDGLKFYDYTKDPNRAKDQPYNLTYSRAETSDNQAHSLELLNQGINVAVVFGVSNRKDKFGNKKPLPQSWQGFKVVDGDINDLRFLDPAGVVVGLRNKGKATKDLTGFVVPVLQVLGHNTDGLVVLKLEA